MSDFVTPHEESQNNGRGPSLATLWKDCPRYEIMNDYNAGYYFRDDFMGDHDLTNAYTATQQTQGTFALDDAEGGVALADCNSTTATQGINVQLSSTVGERFIAATGSKIWFEARVKAADIATGPEFFLGLSEIDTTIIASSANSSANHVGWESTTDDGVLLFFGEKAGTRNSALASPHTLVDDTYVKLGFFVDGVDKVEHYVDGTLQTTTLATANIPIVAMTPSLVCQSGGTTDPIVHLDWWECFVENRIP